MREAAIVATARTGIGKAYRGAFNDTEAPVLSSHVVNAVLDQRALPTSLELRHSDAPPIPCRRVPPLAAPPIWLRQPRLRYNLRNIKYRYNWQADRQ